MKINRTLFVLMPALVFSVWLSSCDDNEGSGGTPTVSYVRLTDPEKADSAMTSANMGQLIAIVGEHLGTLKECYFNDLKASLNPAYISDKSVLVNVPNALPSEITNKMTMRFEDGYELVYDFTIDVAPPILTGIKCEYVKDGDNVILYGDFLFEPTVYFSDGAGGQLEGTVVREEKEELEVTVPAGAGTGQIVIENTIGTAESPFLFRDDRNVIVNFDDKPSEDWTGELIQPDSVDSPPVKPVSGNYLKLAAENITAWFWSESLMMLYWPANSGGANVPIAEGSQDQLDFRFEVNVPSEWVDVRMEIYFAPFDTDHGRDLKDEDDRDNDDDVEEFITSFYRWEPWRDGAYTTDGWITISIPLSDFNYGHDDGDGIPPEQGTNPLTDISDLTNVTMMVFGPASKPGNSVEMYIDNVRIVPNTID